MPVLAEVNVFPVCIVILCSKVIIFLQFYCVYVFPMVVKINFRSNTATEGKLASNVKGAMQVASEKGASSWLATLPIAEHGFALYKGAF